MRIAFQMDDIESLDISGDSSFALLLEAQQRGHEIFYYTPSELSMLEARVFARGHGLKVIDKRGEHFKKSAASTEDLSGFDCIFLRQDPPFDMNYITSTHLLERLTPETLVVNDPAHVRNAPEKLLVTEFQSLTPPTLITRSLEEVKNFRETHREIIVKPLYGNGGAGVFHLQPEDRNLGALIEIFQTNFREPFIVQKYLPEIRDGDKRIILVDGEVAGAINRVPQENEARSNLHIGGRAEATELTPHDHEICQTLAPHLKRRGLIFTGIDVIGDYLTEINVTSPTGIREVKRFGGKDIAALIFDCVEKKISDQRK